MKKFLPLIGAALIAGLFLASCGDPKKESKKEVKVESVSLSLPEGINVEKGKSLKVASTVLPADATNPELTWTSSDPSKAVVEAGVVTGVAVTEEGKGITITATSADGSEKKAEVTVYVLDKVVRSTKLSLIGKTSTFVGKTIELTPVFEPEDVTDTFLTWTSSKSDVATVDKDGIVTAVKAGKTTVTAVARDGGSKAAFEIEITAAPVPVDAVELSTEDGKDSAFIGSTVILKPVFTPKNASNQKVTYEITDGAELASLDEEGLGILTVNDEDKTGSVTVTVTTVKDEDMGDDESWTEKSAELTLSINRPVAEITLTSADYDTEFGIPVVEGEEGNTAQLNATVKAKTANEPTDPTVTWTSSDVTVATVDQDGVVTSVAAGSATITATANDGSGIAGTFDVVTYIPVEAIEIATKSGKTELNALSKDEVAVTFTPANATYKTVNYTVSNNGAEVSDTNEITAGDKANAAVTITAESVQGKKTAQMTISVVLDTSVLEALNADAVAKRGTITDEDITTDVTGAGQYLQSVVDEMDKYQADAAAMLASPVSQNAINTLAANLAAAIKAFKPIALYGAEALNAERVTGIIISSDKTVKGNQTANLNGNPGAIPPAYTNLYTDDTIDESIAKVVATEDGRNVYLMNVSENKYISFSDFNNMKSNDGYYNAAHFSVLTSADFEIGFYRYGDDGVGPYLFHFDVENRKTFLKDKEGNLTPVDSTWSRDENLWYSIDVNFTSVYRAPNLTGPIVDIVFASATGADRYYLDNVYFHEVMHTAEYFVEKLDAALKSAKQTLAATTVGENIGNVPEASYNAFQSAISSAESTLSSSDVMTLFNALKSLEEASAVFAEASVKLGFNATYDAINAAEWTESLFYTSSSKIVSASTGPAENAFDGNTGTIWDGATNPPKWLAVEFQEPVKFNVIKFLWEGAFSVDYDIQASEDGVNWFSLFNVTDRDGTTSGPQTLTLEGTYTTRFIRWYGYKSTNDDWGQKFYEWGLFYVSNDKLIAKLNDAIASANAALDSAQIGDNLGQTPQAEADKLEAAIATAEGFLESTDTDAIKAATAAMNAATEAFIAACKQLTYTKDTAPLTDTDFAANLLAGATYTSSSGDASQAFDGNLTTRWESASSDPQWLAIETAAPVTFNTIKFRWEGAYSSHYFIQISDDGESWVNAIEVNIGKEHYEEFQTITMEQAVTAQYVRFLGTERGLPYGHSFYEMAASLAE